MAATATVLIAIALASLVSALVVAAATGAALAMRGRRLAGATDGGGIAVDTPREVAPLRIVHGGMLAALALLAAALAARVAATGHAPWSNLHETSAAFGAGVIAAHLVVARRAPIGGLAPLSALVAAGLLAFALGLDDRVQPLVPALQQPVLLTVHVGSAIAAYAISAIAFVAAVGELAQRAAGDRIRGLPPAAVSRAVAHRAAIVAFPVLTLAIALGAIWANLAWRAFWSNDPKELAAAATWFVYAGYLHVAARRDRWGAAAPWLLVAGFGAVLFTFVGASLVFVGEHSYAAP